MFYKHTFLFFGFSSFFFSFFFFLRVEDGVFRSSLTHIEDRLRLVIPCL